VDTTSDAPAEFYSSRRTGSLLVELGGDDRERLGVRVETTALAYGAIARMAAHDPS
jgi:hypothetical protein